VKKPVIMWSTDGGFLQCITCILKTTQDVLINSLSFENGLHSGNPSKSSWDEAHSRCRDYKKNFRCACLREHVL
jgi:hypothetical protein